MRLSELKIVLDTFLEQHGDMKLWISYVGENEMLIHKEVDVEFELLKIPELEKPVLEVHIS